MFERKVPKFFKPASRASQKQMATAMREAMAKARQASNLGEVIDAVLDIPSEYIDNKLLRLVKTHPQADLQELEDILNKQYIKRTAYASSAVGAGAAVPGSGTGIALGLTAGELAVTQCRPPAIFWEFLACTGYARKTASSAAHWYCPAC